MKLHKKQVIATAVLIAMLAGCSSNKGMQEAPAESSSSPQNKSMQNDDSMANRANSDSSMQADVVQDAAESERLGTQWGDDVDSYVTTVDLRRTSNEPIEQMQINYADKNYKGRTLNSRSLVAGKVDFSVATDRGKLPIFRDAGNYYLQGQAGQAYRLVYKNNSPNTYEIVASVDGLNVLDGSTASRYDSGYVLSPNEELVIEGFRKSQEAVASFIFSKPENAYAANTNSGSIENTGVIGTVIYQLYDPKKPRPRGSQAFPADGGYAPAPQ